MMLVTFVYSIVWMLLLAGFSGILSQYVQARLVCDGFDSNTEDGLDDPDNCFHYVDTGKQLTECTNIVVCG